MSEPTQLPADPVAQPHDPESSPTDPLLGSGSYIDPGRSDSGGGTESASEPPLQIPDFPPGVVIAAEPISMYIPGDESPEARPMPRSAPPPRRSHDEMSKRPSWLPEGWSIDLRVRSSGATAGLIDRYYVAPTGQRRFRSKVEVMHFLETGSRLKRKSASETDTTESSGTPSGTPASQKQRKPYTKRKKSEVLNSDKQPPEVVNGVQADKGL